MNRAALDETLANATRLLLDARNSRGHWEGELSSSALSTATAVFALHLYLRRHGEGLRKGEIEGLIERGLGWLARNQNEDGGWGDTTLSFSNISTTVLSWSALAPFEGRYEETLRRGERWLVKHAGSLEPEALARAIIARYGKDKTFSVPILTMAALAGRVPWRLVPQLPFELAALPHDLWTIIKLPVVSYALPALISMGHARHAMRPTWNPLARGLRQLTSDRTLSLLEAIQPRGGGFLEATPLTSFVTMSLLACETTAQGGRVIGEGVDFLVRSAREDGSWPIDTNLATWVTTLSVNALANHGDFERLLPADERKLIVDWLLGQQYKVEHPYTHAAPGGWAWTDLPGGVPDADDTAGAVIALKHLAPDDVEVKDAAAHGIDWLLSLQNRDGGIPTFCRGWGSLPFDRSGPDLTAHALLAWSRWGDCNSRVGSAITRAMDYLEHVKDPLGSWTPLWFGNQCVKAEENQVYGTARVLGVLCELAGWESCFEAAQWLIAAQNEDGGFGGNRDVPSSVEETGLALHALASYLPEAPSPRQGETAIRRASEFLIGRTGNGRQFPCAPIGFYFAKLWYYEKLYPLIFAVGGLARAAKALDGPTSSA